MIILGWKAACMLSSNCPKVVLPPFLVYLLVSYKKESNVNNNKRYISRDIPTIYMYY